MHPPKRYPTRRVCLGPVSIGEGLPIAVQSMTATRTQDVEATTRQLRILEDAGADVIRIAVDNQQDVSALARIAPHVRVALSVDLQENYRLIREVAPFVHKVRYNPGHLHHHQPDQPVRDKVAFIAGQAAHHGCALRVGVNCGSVDPRLRSSFPADDSLGPMLASAWEHCSLLDDLGFTQYCVSLKDSDPYLVVEANRRFAAQRPEVPLHLGVTEAGMPPDGIIKTRIAFEQLIPQGIGDTIRVSLTLPFADKAEEIHAGRKILADIAAGNFLAETQYRQQGLEIISCPSCSRVENEAFVELAHKVRSATRYARAHRITIAVMGCRVNGPGETDEADIGLWCGPSFVNLKRGRETIGRFSYDAVLQRLTEEVDRLIAARG